MEEEPITVANSVATKRFQQLDPQLLEKVRTDPDESRPYYRTISMITDHELYQLRNQLPVPQRLALAERWSKLAGMEPKKVEAQQSGAQFSIQINIPEVGTAAATSRIIEGTANEEVQLPEIVSKLSEIRQVHQSGGGASGIDEDDDEHHQDFDGGIPSRSVSGRDKAVENRLDSEHE
jgi:hypothetical protein